MRPQKAVSPRVLLLAGLGTLIAYTAAALIGLEIAIVQNDVPALWIPAGIAVTALYRFGTWMAPAIAIGTIIVAVSSSFGFGPVGTIGMAIANTLGPMIAVWLMRWMHFDAALSRRGHIPVFFLFAVIIGPLITASIGTAGLVLSGLVPANYAHWSMLGWWFSDGAGVMIAAPILLSLTAEGRRHRSGVRWKGMVERLVVAAVLGTTLYVGLFAAPTIAPIISLVLPVPLLIWCALRFGVQETAIGLLILAVFCLASVFGGGGPFVREDVVGGGQYQAQLAYMWTYVAILSFTGLLLTALIEELSLLYRKVLQQAKIDSLTGVLARAAIEDRLAAEIAHAHNNHRSLSVLMLDLDNFKKINDTKGHLIGDRVLATTARRALRVIRGSDEIGRFGGEEFLVVLPRASHRAAMEVAERLRDAIGSFPIPIDERRAFDTQETRSDHTEVAAGPTVRVTVSIGVAFLSPDDDRGSLLARADKALYVAKRAGRDRVINEDDVIDGIDPRPPSGRAPRSEAG